MPRTPTPPSTPAPIPPPTPLPPPGPDPLHPPQLPPPDAMPSPQGWTLTPSHPLYSSLPPPSHPPTFSSTPLVTSYLRSHTRLLLTHPDFSTTAPTAIDHLLSQPWLSVTEDELVTALNDYIAAHPSDQHQPLWKRFLKRITIVNLKTESVLLVLEPLGILTDDQLLIKYRIDALPPTHPAPSLPTTIPFRGLAKIYEAQPEVGEQIDHVFTTRRATRHVVEFDRTTKIPADAHLVFYSDRNATNVIWTWEWLRAHTIKVLVVHETEFWIGVKGAAYRILVTSLPDD